MKVHSALSPGFVSLASSIGAGLPVFGMQAVSERMDIDRLFYVYRRAETLPRIVLDRGNYMEIFRGKGLHFRENDSEKVKMTHM